MALTTRGYTQAEVDLGVDVHERLAREVQSHAGACPCALCAAWLTLCPLAVYGDAINRLRTNSVVEDHWEE